MKRMKDNFTTIVLCCYALFLLFLLSSGNIRKLINPKLSFLSVISLVIIGAMILHNFAKATGKGSQSHGLDHYHGLGHDHSSHCCHHHEKENEPSHIHASNYLLFLPIALSVLFPPGIIGYQTVTGMDVTSANVSSNAVDQNQITVHTNQNQYVTPIQGINVSSGGFNTNQSGNGDSAPARNQDEVQNMLEQFVPAGFREYTQIDIGNTIFNGDKQAKQEMTHDKIFLKGKVLESKEIPQNELVLYRMVITCCAADGMPAGIVINLPLNNLSQETLKFKPEEWVAVEGTIQIVPFDKRLKNLDPITVMVPPENIYPVLTASKIYRVQPPRDEYLYP